MNKMEDKSHVPLLREHGSWSIKIKNKWFLREKRKKQVDSTAILL